MLMLLTKGMRRRAGFALGVLFFLCSVAPSFAISFTAATAAAHCLTENHHATTTHDHADEAVGHDEPWSASDDQSSGTVSPPLSSCCGLFCVSGAPLRPSILLHGKIAPTAPESLVELSFVGDSPAGIDRPPKLLLSL